MDIKKQINNAIETGEVLLGSNMAMNKLLNADPKLILLAANCPREQREAIEYYGRLADVPIIVMKDDSIELGSSIGRSHGVAALTVVNEGESTILEVNK